MTAVPPSRGPIASRTLRHLPGRVAAQAVLVTALAWSVLVDAHLAALLLAVAILGNGLTLLSHLLVIRPPAPSRTTCDDSGRGAPPTTPPDRPR